MGGSSQQTVGYWYHPVFQVVLGRGPVDAITRVRAADVEAWSGRLTASGAIPINNPELWGGESSEGGIVGDLVAFMGDEAQAPISFVSEQLGPDPSAHKGQLSMVFTGGRFGAMNPYPKPLSILLRRILEGWELAGGSCWYPEKAPIPMFEGASTPTVTGVEVEFNFNQDPPVDVGGGFPVTSSGSPQSNVSGEGMFQSNEYYIATVPHSLPPLSVEIDARFAITADARTTSPIVFAGIFNNPASIDVVQLAYVGASGPTQRGFSLIVNNDDLLYLMDGPGPISGTVRGTWDAATSMARLYIDDVEVASGTMDQAQTLSSGWTVRAGLMGALTDPADVLLDNVRVRVGTPGVIAEWLAMNPAHVLYFSLVADSMQGEPASFVNEASFQAAADLFYDEGLGICTEWDADNETVEQFRARICEAVGARMSRSTVDGQWYLDVMRGQYDLESLPTLTDDDILDFEAEPAVLDDAVNQVAVQWFDPVTKQERTTAPLQALGAIDAGGVNAQTLSYGCLPTESLALRTAARELRARATPLWRFKLVTTRKPYSWRTGTYFRLQAPKRGVADMVCLVGDIEKGTLRSGAISITAVQDVYAMPATTYVEAQAPIEPPSSTPVPVVDQLAFEAPYIELVQSMSAADRAALAADTGYLAAVGARPGIGINYELNTRPGAGDYTAIGNFDWCPTASIVEAADKASTAFTLADASLLDRVAVGTAALWDDEIVRVDALDAVAGTVTLARGCADTVPHLHAAGARIWFYDAWSGSDAVEYLDGETAQAKLLTRTGTAALVLAAAPAASVTFDSRAARPYPPGGFQINGESWPLAAAGSLDVSWAHRDRELQADQMVDTTEASVGPEAGTTYSLLLTRTDTDAVLDTATGETGTSHTVSGAYTGEVRLQLWSVRGGLESWQRQEHVFLYAGSDGRATEAGETRATEAAELREME